MRVRLCSDVAGVKVGPLICTADFSPGGIIEKANTETEIIAYSRSMNIMSLHLASHSEIMLIITKYLYKITLPLLHNNMFCNKNTILSLLQVVK